MERTSTSDTELFQENDPISSKRILMGVAKFMLFSILAIGFLALIPVFGGVYFPPWLKSELVWLALLIWGLPIILFAGVIGVVVRSCVKQ